MRSMNDNGHCMHCSWFSPLLQNPQVKQLHWFSETVSRWWMWSVVSGQWSVVYHVCSASTSFFILCCFTALESIIDDVSGSNPISSRLVLRIQRGVLPFQHLVISQCLGKLFGSCHADGTLSRQPAFASVILWVPVEAIFLRSYGVDWEGLCSQEFSSYIYASGTAVYVCTPVVRWLILSFPSSCRDKGTITLRLWWSSSTRMHIIVLRMQVRSANGCQNGSR